MLKPKEVWDRYYLDVRCMLIEIAATLDRYEASRQRESREDAEDARLAKVRDALEILQDPAPADDRAAQLLMLFSEPKE